MIAELMRLVARSLWHHRFPTMLLMAAIALGSGLVMAVFAIVRQSEEAFTAERQGFDAVLSARGSQLQLVMNAVFHLDVSPGNVPWKMYETLKANPTVELAIPYALGDNFKGFRIIGTSEELFTKFRFRDGGAYEVEGEGRFFDVQRREVVVGSFAARKAGLKLGDVIQPYHGLTYDPNAKHDEEYVVVGILKPTNSPADRVIWMPIEGVFRMEGHVLRGDGEEFRAEAGAAVPDEHKEVSAVMLKLRNPASGFFLQQTINRQGTVATMAYPVGNVMADLFDRFGWMTRVLRLVAFLVVVVGAVSLAASLYSGLEARRREFAILRAVGAGRGFLLAVVVAESALIAGLGSLLGFAVYGAIVLSVAEVLREATGVVLTLATYHPVLLWTCPAVTLMGGLAGLLPGLAAYRTDVATNLIPTT